VADPKKRPAQSTPPAKTAIQAKDTGTSKSSEPPLCIAMVVCDQVLIGEDHLVSAIRIVDTITVGPETLPKEPDGIEFPALRLLAMLKKGDSEGPFDLLLECTDPARKTEPIGISEGIALQGGPEAGTNLIVPLRLSNVMEGLYWLQLRVSNCLIAKAPVRLVFTKAKASE
jgi:hypothetical protein